MFRYRFVFAKTGALKYISHLDMMRLFSRALRRAALPVKLTEGFNPHPKLSLARALKLGVESEHEEGAFVLRELIASEEVAKRLNLQLPKGIQVKEVHLS